SVGRQACRQRAHVEALETKPRQMRSLQTSRACHQMGIQINREDVPRWADLLSKVEGRDAVAGGNIQNSGSRNDIQMLQQRLRKRRGPVVLLRERPAWHHST